MNFETFLISLNIMWKGMFGIFTVIILITLLVMLMQKLDALSKKEENK